MVFISLHATAYCKFQHATNYSQHDSMFSEHFGPTSTFLFDSWYLQSLILPIFQKGFTHFLTIYRKHRRLIINLNNLERKQFKCVLGCVKWNDIILWWLDQNDWSRHNKLQERYFAGLFCQFSIKKTYVLDF